MGDVTALHSCVCVCVCVRVCVCTLCKSACVCVCVCDSVCVCALVSCSSLLPTSLSTACGCLILISLMTLKMSTAPSAFRHSRILATAQNVAERPVEPLCMGGAWGGGLAGRLSGWGTVGRQKGGWKWVCIVGGTVDEVKCMTGRGVDGMSGADTYVRRNKDEWMKGERIAWISQSVLANSSHSIALQLVINNQYLEHAT